jgi:hypothetical protein
MKRFERCLFKPRSSRPAATAEQQVPISVEDLDRGAIGEAVGRVDLLRLLLSTVEGIWRGWNAPSP